ncbi:uncharacterized protein EV420DRAFT_1486465 [Desarmillaria tabescens]|uniref:Secreted protein n=1 Tax=Armillaria tabescens TaxID=1929756 RepID=A0AA39MLC0_ARMTA|nr:uncharacterized protein EV420DRAFT_1486465 [Desarmillaria tabescens]KAK0439081.1 hypothetical protein EV420DRAFT_1486465 [Desarmillaria tabescens]
MYKRLLFVVPLIHFQSVKAELSVNDWDDGHRQKSQQRSGQEEFDVVACVVAWLRDWIAKFKNIKSIVAEYKKALEVICQARSNKRGACEVPAWSAWLRGLSAWRFKTFNGQQLSIETFSNKVYMYSQGKFNSSSTTDFAWPAWPRTTHAWYHAGDHAEFLVPQRSTTRKLKSEASTNEVRKSGKTYKYRFRTQLTMIITTRRSKDAPEIERSTVLGEAPLP